VVHIAAQTGDPRAGGASIMLKEDEKLNEKHPSVRNTFDFTIGTLIHKPDDEQ
jgi:hypothetical protein